MDVDHIRIPSLLAEARYIPLGEIASAEIAFKSVVRRY
jgi:hypothetical protein